MLHSLSASKPPATKLPRPWSKKPAIQVAPGPSARTPSRRRCSFVAEWASSQARVEAAHFATSAGRRTGSADGAGIVEGPGRPRRDAGSGPGRIASDWCCLRQGIGRGSRLAARRRSSSGGAVSSRSFYTGEPSPPAVVLVVSGGHTSLYLVQRTGRADRSWPNQRRCGGGGVTAIVAKLLGLGYPGGR